jgi:hypothetical protein
MTFFYDLNKRLAAVNDAPESKQLNERDMSRAAKGYEKYGKEGMEALAKAGREGKALDPIRKKYDKYNNEVDEGAYQAGPDKSQIPAVNRPGNRMTLQDLEKERTQSPTSPEGLQRAQQRLGQQHPLKEKMSPAKAKSFAALAEPKDKITFADKIAGAKKEVDEMLGDVAAEAMKNALSGGQKKLDKNDNGKLDANDFAMLRKGAKKSTDEAEDNNPFTNYKKPRADKPRVGDVEHGSKHDIEHTATGRKVTRRTDDQGISVGSETDDEGNKQEKRGRGRPKGPAKGTERVTAKAIKHKGEREKKGSAGSVSDAGKSLQGFMIGNKPKNAPGKVSVRNKMKEGDADPADNNSSELKAAMALLKKAGYKVSKDGAEELDEKAVSKKQQRFMGMVHATQKGEKAPSKEVAKVAKSMGKKDAEDFASTKHKGLPEKKKADDAPKKKEKTEEAGGSGTPTASSGFSYGQGIYDSLNRDVENAINESMQQLSESMSINMSDSTEGGKSLTITASDEDAMKLATLLKSAGLGGGDSEGYGGSGYKSACGCGTPDCSCGDQEIDEVSMNEPDYPTNTETGNSMEYSGGLNGPKSTGQSTVPVLASQDDRQHSYAEAEEDALHRMMEMAGVKKKEVEEEKTEEGNKFTKGLEDDNVKIGDKIPGTNAIKKKDIDEGILASTRALWKKYQD